MISWFSSILAADGKLDPYQQTKHHAIATLSRIYISFQMNVEKNIIKVNITS